MKSIGQVTLSLAWALVAPIGVMAGAGSEVEADVLIRKTLQVTIRYLLVNI